jgi:hypothetical protein
MNMAAGFMGTPEEMGDLYARPCALCTELIVEGERYYQRNSWTVFGHMGCVLSKPDEWDALPDEGVVKPSTKPPKRVSY